MTAHDKPAIHAKPIEPLHTGLKYETLPGCIAIYTEHKARHFDGMSIAEWDALEYQQKVRCIAFYLVYQSERTVIENARTQARKKP